MSDGLPPPVVAGLDLSLTSTGIAVIRAGQVTLQRIQPRKLTDCKRLEYIGHAVAAAVDRCDLVVIEGPSYGSTGGSQHERGGLWWLVRYQLWRRSYDVAVVPPALLKKYATGKANAGKDQVIAAVVRRYPDVDVDGNDQADALVLAAMGAHHLGHPLAMVPQDRQSALASVRWP